MVEKALKYFSRNLPSLEKQKVFEAFEASKFGMCSMIFRYKDKYYRYGKQGDNEDVGILVGGFKLDFYSDIVG